MTHILKRKRTKIVISICITALAVYLSFRKLDWNALLETFLKVRISWVLLALLNVLLSVYTLGLRWQILLKPEKKIPINKLFRLNILSQYANIIMPARLGEFIRAYLASKWYNASGPFVMGTIIIEKILDFFIFLSLWILIPFLLSVQKETKEIRIAILIWLVTVLFLFVFIWKPKIFLRGISILLNFLKKNLRQKVQGFIEKGVEAFSLLKNIKTILPVLALTFIFVAGQALTNYFLFFAVGLKLSFWVALFLLLALQLGSMPPAAPGKIGIIEYAVIVGLSVFGISKAEALSYGLLLHLVAFLPKIILGLFYLPSVDMARLKIDFTRAKTSNRN